MKGFISVKDLKKICKAYDKFYDEYPEHEFEGAAVLEFILKHIKVET